MVLECVVDALPAATVTWFKGAFPIGLSDYPQISSLHGGVHRLTIGEISRDWTGIYTASASNALGKASSACSLLIQDSARYAGVNRVNQIKYRMNLS